jgi:N-6 DNA Methylase/TaqI-like C-terminal specificity domain
MVTSTLEKWVDEWYGQIWADQKRQQPDQDEEKLQGTVRGIVLRSLYRFLCDQYGDFIEVEQSSTYPLLEPHPSIESTTLGAIYERLLTYDLTAKKTNGAYYTPPHLVDFVVSQTVEKIDGLPRVVDPACGGGFFLVAAYEALMEKRSRHLGRVLITTERQQILQNCIYGVDIDPQAVAVTQVALSLKLLEFDPKAEIPDLKPNIQCGNAVVDFDWQKAFTQDGFDVVIGNPPYIDSEQMTKYFPDWRQYCAAHYKSATGNWDLFCVFIEKALDLCRSGGLVSLVVPNKLASADYAAGVRSLLASDSQMILIRDYGQTAPFKAAVYPLVFITQKVIRRKANSFRDSQAWATGDNFQQTDLLYRLRETFPKLETIAQVNGAATVAEAYIIQDLIHDDPAGELRMVNSGTIDRYCLLWGKKPLRYLGRSYLHPVIKESERLPSKRLHQAQQPKIIVSGMTQRLECAIDPQGSMLAGKSTTIILPFQDFDIYYLLGILNSRLISFYFRGYFGGNSLQGGYLRVGAPQIRQMPIALSPNLESIINLVHQRLSQPDLSQAIEPEIDRLVYQLYGLTATETQMLEQIKL